LNADKPLILLGLILSVVMIAMTTLRLKWVMSVQSIKLPLADLTCINFVGCFFNNFLPTSIGGDMVKGYYIAKRTNRKMESLSAILMDRLFGFSVLISFAVLVMLFSRGIFLQKILGG